jgi:heme-degrading monooxygenase HmoA
MFARITQIKADPARTDELVDQLKTEMIPVFEKQPGYLGVISSADRSTGLGAVTTYWDSMENLKASEAAIFAARDQFSSQHDMQTISFHRCEIPVQESRSAPRVGQHVRATAVMGGDPAKIDEGIKRYREEVAPLILSLPGAEAAVLLVDRENNISFAISAWDSAEHRDASEAALAPKRQEAAETAGGQAQTMHAETTYADLKMPVTH